MKLPLLLVDPMMTDVVVGEPVDDNDEPEKEGPCKTPLKHSTKFGAAEMETQIKQVLKKYGQKARHIILVYILHLSETMTI